jgi:hypothetical protein
MGIKEQFVDRIYESGIDAACLLEDFKYRILRGLSLYRSYNQSLNENYQPAPRQTKEYIVDRINKTVGFLYGEGFRPDTIRDELKRFLEANLAYEVPVTKKENAILNRIATGLLEGWIPVNEFCENVYKDVKRVHLLNEAGWWSGGLGSMFDRAADAVRGWSNRFFNGSRFTGATRGEAGDNAYNAMARPGAFQRVFKAIQHLKELIVYELDLPQDQVPEIDKFLNPLIDELKQAATNDAEELGATYKPKTKRGINAKRPTPPPLPNQTTNQQPQPLKSTRRTVNQRSQMDPSQEQSALNWAASQHQP